MTEWAAKRFWTETCVVVRDTGHGIDLDGRPVRTPSGLPLVLPTSAAAAAVAAEWDAQAGIIDPGSMPMTRMANSALEKVMPQMDAVRAHLADYAATDLLCYRAAGPAALVQRQAAGWDPVLDWARRTHGADLRVTTGVMPVDQDPALLDRLAARMVPMTAFRLTGFHDLVALSGSFVLALAVAEEALDAAQAFALSRLDEIWQSEQWGRDETATEAADFRSAAFLDAERFIRLT